MSYWDQREEERLYNSTLGVAEKQLADEYRRVFKKTQNELLTLYNELVNEKGEILVSDLFRFNRYYELLNELQQSLYKLGIKEEILYERIFADYYKENCKIIGNQFHWNFPLDDDEVKKAINGVWCADGKSWSDRIWSNKTLLQERIREGIVDCVASGASKDQLVKRLMEDFNVGLHQADRIARTELLANQADDESCGSQHQKVFLISEAQVGVNFPPFHPNCKCCIIPVKRGG